MARFGQLVVMKPSATKSYGIYEWLYGRWWSFHSKRFPTKQDAERYLAKFKRTHKMYRDGSWYAKDGSGWQPQRGRG